MRFLLDHDVPETIVRVLARAGHEVILVREVLAVNAPDQKVLEAGTLRVAGGIGRFLGRKQIRGVLLDVRRMAPLRGIEGDAVAAKDVAMHVAAMKPVALSSGEVPRDLVDRERRIANEKAADSGKPAEIVTKMVEGSVQKFLKEVSLLNQPFVKNDKQTVEQMLKERKTSVKGFTLYVVGEGIERKADDFAAEVAAQVAAAKGT